MDKPTPIYKLYDVLERTAISDENIKAVTTGDITKIDISKHTIFELGHFQINNIGAAYEDETSNGMRIIRPNITFFIMDKLISDKDDTNNELDVYNTLFVAGINILNKLDDINQNTELEAKVFNVNFEPFTERFENVLIGYAITFDLEVPYENLC